MIDYIEEEDDDDDFALVKEADYLPELEQKVKEYMLITPTLPRNEEKYSYVSIPAFTTAEAERVFWHEQIRRCKEGYKGICGKMYFFFNFCWIENLGGGRIRPEFRVVDAEWFKFIEDAQRSKRYGVICVKRRRVGASWKEAADVLHDCLFNKNFHVGMNSKSERDSILLFRKVKFLYNALPDALRASTTSSTKMFLDFRYIDPDTKKIEGNFSDITVVAPTDSAYEGMMLNKWVCDEAGKIVNLPQMWSYTEDCMMQETRRVGCPIIFGTSGDVGKDGAGLMEMWDNHDVYNLKRFFFAGYMGLYVDEFGNDYKEDCIRWIIYQRHRRSKLSTKFYNDFLQKYPLTVEEAFVVNGDIGLGDVVKLKAQRASLVLNPAVSVKGNFKEENGKVVFHPDNFGQCIIYEHPTSNLKAVGGCDPADIDDVSGEASELSTYIMAIGDGIKRPRILFEYTDRPRELNKYYEQAMLACRYYNDAKILIERNKGGRMISYFSDSGYKYLLMTQPVEVQRLVATRSNQIGVHMNEYAKETLRGLGGKYVDTCYDILPSIKLIDECIVYGTRNTDRAMAFGICLIALQEVNKPYLHDKKGKIDPRLPKVSYVKDSLGNIRLIRKV